MITAAEAKSMYLKIREDAEKKEAERLAKRMPELLAEADKKIRVALMAGKDVAEFGSFWNYNDKYACMMRLRELNFHVNMDLRDILPTRIMVMFVPWANEEYQRRQREKEEQRRMQRVV